MSKMRTIVSRIRQPTLSENAVRRGDPDYWGNARDLIGEQ